MWQVIFGVDPERSVSVPRLLLEQGLPAAKGAMAWDDAFDLSSAWAQDHFLNMTASLRAAPCTPSKGVCRGETYLSQVVNPIEAWAHAMQERGSSDQPVRAL